MFTTHVLWRRRVYTMCCAHMFLPNLHLFSRHLSLYTCSHYILASIPLKICYDKAGNLPNKGRNFNTQTWGKIVYFLFVWLVGIGFRQKSFRVLPNFGDFGAKMSFFHYIINQKRNNFIKHCSPPPPCTKKPLISEMCIYIKSSLCKWGLGTRGGGGDDVL